MKSNGKPTIPCESCAGTGRVPVSPKYQEVLTALKPLKRATCLTLLSTLNKHSPKLKIVALHKRLARMETAGLVRRVQKVTPKGGDPRQRSWEFEVVS